MWSEFRGCIREINGGNLMNILVIVNDTPYGTEKAYNAPRLTMTLQKISKESNHAPWLDFQDG